MKATGHTQAAIEKAPCGRLAKEKDSSGLEATEEVQLGDKPDEQECKTAVGWKKAQSGIKEVQNVRRQLLQRVSSKTWARRAEEEQIWMI